MRVNKYNSGSALLIAFVSVFFISLLLIGMFKISYSGFQRAVYNEYESQAYYTAKSALDLYEEAMKRNVDDVIVELEGLFAEEESNAEILKNIVPYVDFDSGKRMGKCRIDARYDQTDTSNKVLTLIATAWMGDDLWNPVTQPDKPLLGKYVMSREFNITSGPLSSPHSSDVTDVYEDAIGGQHIYFTEPAPTATAPVKIYEVSGDDISSKKFFHLGGASEIVIYLRENAILNLQDCHGFDGTVKHIFIVMEEGSQLGLGAFDGHNNLDETAMTGINACYFYIVFVEPSEGAGYASFADSVNPPPDDGDCHLVAYNLSKFDEKELTADSHQDYINGLSASNDMVLTNNYITASNLTGLSTTDPLHILGIGEGSSAPKIEQESSASGEGRINK